MILDATLNRRVTSIAKPETVYHALYRNKSRGAVRCRRVLDGPSPEHPVEGLAQQLLAATYLDAARECGTGRRLPDVRTGNSAKLITTPRCAPNAPHVQSEQAA